METFEGRRVTRVSDECLLEDNLSEPSFSNHRYSIAMYLDNVSLVVNLWYVQTPRKLKGTKLRATIAMYEDIQPKRKRR